MMNCKLFNKIVIGIAIIALSVTPIVYFVYFVGIGAIWTRVDEQADPITATATFVLALTSIVATFYGLSTYFKEIKKNSDKKEEKYKHDRIKVKPLLQIVSDRSDPILHQWLEFKIINQGLGPAVIKNFILKFDDEELTRNNYNSHISKINEKLWVQGIEDLTMKIFMPDSVIRAGQSKLLLSIKYNAEEYDFDCLKKIDILVEYYSIYKDETFTCSIKDIRLPDDSESK